MVIAELNPLLEMSLRYYGLSSVLIGFCSCLSLSYFISYHLVSYYMHVHVTYTLVYNVLASLLYYYNTH